MSRPLASCLALSLVAACPRVHAAIDLDLSYVDTSSPEFARFKAYVDRAVGVISITAFPPPTRRTCTASRASRNTRRSPCRSSTHR
jgi:hypothetical protein